MNNNNNLEAGGGASTPQARLYERRARRSTQFQLINLSNLPGDLSLSQRKSKSISFSGVSFVIDRLLSYKHSMSSSQLEAEEALQSGDAGKILEIQTSRDGRKLSGLAKAAIRSGDEELIESTLMAIESLNSRDHYDLLHFAAEYGDEKTCTILVEQYGLIASAFDSEGYTPVHYAACEGHMTILQLLHFKGRGDLNASLPDRENGPWTPLHAAVLGNQVASVEYLLANKANTAPVAFSATPLHLAAENNNVGCIEALLAHSALVDPLKGQRERVTPLHIACSNGYLEASQTLLQHGADPNSRNGRGETPLHLACRVLAAPLIILLIEKGAMVEAVDPEGRPPLHYVINSKQRGGGRECMRILLEKGANINQVDNIGMTPIHIASFNANSAKLEYLIEQGADLCVRNNAGKPGLQFALKHLPSTTMLAIQKRMDESITTTSGAESDIDSEVKLNFGMFLPPPQVNPKNARSEVEMFSEMLTFKAIHIDKLLLHPLSQCYLHLKWAQIQKFYYILIVLSHLIYSIFYTIYSATVYRVLCSPVGHTGDIITCNFTAASPRNLALTSWLLLIIFTMVYVAKESTKALHQKWQYLKEYESWLNICTSFSFILISFHNNPFAWKENNIEMGRWQYHVNGIGVFTTWLLQMFLIGRVPRFGLYVEIFKKVSKTFINFFLAFVFLFVAFACSFLALFPEHRAFSSSSPAVLIKVMVMMLGELEYDDLLHPLNLIERTNGSTTTIDEVDQFIHFPFASVVMVAIFILLVSFIIMNLLFGLAVADIQELYKQARVHQLIQQVQLISYMERVLLSPASNCLPQWLNVYIRNQFKGLKNHGRYFNVHSNTKTKSLQGLPSDLVELTYSKASELNCHEKKEGSLSTEKRLSELSEKMDMMQKLLKDFLDQNQKVLSSSQDSTMSVRSSNNIDSLDNKTQTL